MLAQLGNIQFDKQFSFNGLSQGEDASWVEHSIINTKNRLQPTGQNLKDVAIDMILRQDFCDIPATIDQIRDYKENFSSLDLLWGNGKIEGTFVIMGFNIARQFLDTNGTMIQAAVNVRLKEYYVPDKLTAAETTARNNAIAVGVKAQAAIIPPDNIPPESKVVADSAGNVLGCSGNMDDICAKYSNSGDQNKTLLDNLNVVINEANKIAARVNDPLSGLYLNTPLLDTAGRLASTATVFSGIVNANILGGDNGIVNVQNQNAIYQVDAFEFLALLLGFTLGSIVRNG